MDLYRAKIYAKTITHTQAHEIQYLVFNAYMFGFACCQTNEQHLATTFDIWYVENLNQIFRI